MKSEINRGYFIFDFKREMPWPTGIPLNMVLVVTKARACEQLS